MIEDVLKSPSIKEARLPELPEVEVLRRGLAPLLLGKHIESVHCAVPTLRYPLPNNLNERLAGHVFRGINRRAKYLLFNFDFDLLLAWHLGMTGQFHVLDRNGHAGAHEHVRINCTDGCSLRYRDTRRFGYAGLLSTHNWQAHPWFRHLGPEPLSDGFNAEYLFRQCRSRNAPIKNVLMDARIVVGIGNIYASESLFQAGIHPRRAANRISFERLNSLSESIKAVLRAAIRAGGSTIRNYVHADGGPGYFAHQFTVYGRKGESCHRCGKGIRRLVLAGRSSFYCPGCQH